MAFTFFMPSVSLMGPGCSDNLPDEIKSRGFKKALIVCGKRSAKSAEFKGITDNLAANGVEFVVYPGSQPNPTVTNVMDGVKILKDNGCDFVISYGGGSPHDCAKGIALVAANGGNIKDYEGVNVSKKPQLPLIAINTTAGTASEMTIFAIITDEERHVKMAIVDKHVNPILAVNDPNLMVSMPASLTAATGMDALTHAIEGLITRGAWEMSDMFHIKAIELISKHLRGAVENTKEGREGMALGQYIAGMGFSNVGLGIVHSMAHPLGALYDTPHGVANAIILPTVMEYNAEVTGDKYKYIAKAMGVENVENMSVEEYRKAAIDAVKKLSSDIGIPSNLKDIVKVEDIDFLAQSAYDDACRPGNPKETSVEDIANLYKSLL